MCVHGFVNLYKNPVKEADKKIRNSCIIPKN